MPQRKKVAYFKDFTGGLNLRTQRQNLSINESPKCLDVDFNARGGIQLRRGYRHVTADANMSTAALGGYVVGQVSFGTEMLWGVSNVGRLWTWDGATATHVATAITTNVTTEFVRGIPWTAKLYFANAYNGGTTLVMRYWNGAAFTALTNTVNNNYTAPTGGNAPLARLIADHGGHMWWADTVEAGTRYRSRLRFSHPLQPEDFAAADYFDIEPDDQTDQITALVPFRGQLLVFKKRAVYAVYGTSRDDFVVERISATAGAWQQEGVTVGPDAVYWWSPDGEIYAYDGRSIVAAGNKVSIVAQNGTIAPGGDHRLLWAEGRLYVSFATLAGSRLTYVFDPLVGQAGAWTQYSVPISSMFWWRRSGGLNGIMLRIVGQAGVADMNVTTQKTDYNGTTSAPIPGYYFTSWFTADDPALMKRWKRLYVTAASDDEANLFVDVFHDFNESTVVKSLTLPIAPSSGSGVWGSGTWGSGVWGSSDPVYLFDRMPSAGRGHAIRLKIYVTNHLGSWSVDSFALPYLEKVYR